MVFTISLAARPNPRKYRSSLQAVHSNTKVTRYDIIRPASLPFCKKLVAFDFEKVKIDEAKVCLSVCLSVSIVCLSVCLSVCLCVGPTQAIPLKTVEVIIIKLGSSNCFGHGIMHHVLMIFNYIELDFD